MYAYNMVEHPVAVHLDVDSLILLPLDVIYDAMIYKIGTFDLSHLLTAVGTPLPTGRIGAYFTCNYNIIVHPGRAVGVHGGFLDVRPDLGVYKEYHRIVLEGDHHPLSVWGGGG